MPPDLIVVAASNGENLKLAERCVHAASQRQAQAELIDLTVLSLPLYTPRVQAAGAGADLISLRDRLHAAPLTWQMWPAEVTLPILSLCSEQCVLRKLMGSLLVRIRATLICWDLAAVHY